MDVRMPNLPIRQVYVIITKHTSGNPTFAFEQ